MLGVVHQLPRHCQESEQRLFSEPQQSFQHLLLLHCEDEVHFPRAQGGTWGEVLAPPRWRTEQGQVTWQRVGSLVYQQGLLSPEEQQEAKSSGKPASSILELNRASSPEPWTQPKACPTFPAGLRGWEGKHSLALDASVPVRSFPCPLLGAWLGTPVMCAGK